MLGAMRNRLAAVLLVCLLAGCARSGVVVVTVTASPGSSATPSATPTATPVKPPTVPNATGAAIVYGLASFASPDGRTWCASDGRSAWCHFPNNFKGTIPDGKKVCPGEGLDVTGVSVVRKADYFCSGEPTANPARGQSSVAWHARTSFGWVSVGGRSYAVLPIGKKLKNGNYICASEKEGVTCASLISKHGFRMSRATVTTF